MSDTMSIHMVTVGNCRFYALNGSVGGCSKKKNSRVSWKKSSIKNTNNTRGIEKYSWMEQGNSVHIPVVKTLFPLKMCQN
jgi:hypothetical protein